MNNTFEANFTGSGTPTIKIYKVVAGKYVLVKTANMIATPETGKYSFLYSELEQLSDYSARMTLGDETQNAVYNGIFSTILARTVERGGGGGGSYKMTQAELERIVEEMGILLRDSLSQIEISLPTGLGEFEISNAVSVLKNAGADVIKSMKTSQKIQEKAIKSVYEKAEKKWLNATSLEKKVDQILAIKGDISSKMKDAIIEEISTMISDQGEKFKDFTTLLESFRSEQKKEAKDFARLLAAFRNELKR